MSEAAHIESTGAETIVAVPAEPYIGRGGNRRGNRHQDVRFEQSNAVSRGSYNTSQSTRSTNQGSNKSGGGGHQSWNPPAPNTESHWEDTGAVAPAIGHENRRQRNSRRQPNDQNGVGMDTLDDAFLNVHNNTYDGTRREFVNSKNRGGAAAGVNTTLRNNGTSGIAPLSSKTRAPPPLIRGAGESPVDRLNNGKSRNNATAAVNSSSGTVGVTKGGSRQQSGAEIQVSR